MVLQAALEAGMDIPHYCYHPSLSVVASCRLCLMEMKVPDPKSGELVWMPKLVPSCQTPVKEGMEVRFNSPAVQQNQQQCMEYFLLNHPLDCPVCDQAGECYLQDYSYRFGQPTSRMVEEKLKNPKKDVGPRTLLYQDRCVMCSRCVRFTDEIAGTHELTVVNRGNRAEIDVFPGLPLNNPLQGNVVDLCPVGSLLDKDFLFKQRVWLLRETKSICPGCSTGCAIRIDHNEGVIYRLKPRFSPKVNDYWMCDEGRFGWKYLQDGDRLTRPVVRRGGEVFYPRWEDIPEIINYRLRKLAEQQTPTAVVLSPMLACEEAWLIASYVRALLPQAVLVASWLPVQGAEQNFPVGSPAEKARFTIRPEKCPNRRGVELLINKLGGASSTLEDLIKQVKEKKIKAAWITGGYSQRDWVSKELAAAAKELELLVMQDLYANALTDNSHVLLPSCCWAEREGSFVNQAGLIQPFERAVDGPEGTRRDGQYLYEIAGYSGLYRAEKVRERMAEQLAEFRDIYVAPDPPEHQH